jgi:glycogen synthase
MCSTEAVPFAKTGGLADVVGALPFAMQRLGQRDRSSSCLDMAIFFKFYKDVELDVPMPM